MRVGILVAIIVAVFLIRKQIKRVRLEGKRHDQDETEGRNEEKSERQRTRNEISSIQDRSFTESRVRIKSTPNTSPPWDRSHLRPPGNLTVDPFRGAFSDC